MESQVTSICHTFKAHFNKIERHTKAQGKVGALPVKTSALVRMVRVNYNSLVLNQYQDFATTLSMKSTAHQVPNDFDV